MATARILLDVRSKKEDNTSPLKLVITHLSKAFYIGVGISVMEDQWDGKFVIEHPKAKDYNGLLKIKLIQAESIILGLEASGRLSGITPAELKAKIVNNNAEFTESVKQPTEVKQYKVVEHFERYIANCKADGTKTIYKRTLSEILKYSPLLTFPELNIMWLKSFSAVLSKKCGVNTVAIHMRNIRAVFNDAINEDKVDLNLYPFRKFKIKKEKEFKGALTIKQLKQFRDCEAEEHQKRYQDLAMLSFFLIGINTVDLLQLRHQDYVNGRIQYIRAKTGRKYSIEVLPEAEKLIEKYKGENYLINVMDSYTDYKDFKSRFNKNLKEIGKLEWVANNARNPEDVKLNKKHYIPLFPDLTVYHFRRTWATIADSLEISMDTIALCLGHGGNTVTNTYVNRDLRKVDEANRKVLTAIK